MHSSAVPSFVTLHSPNAHVVNSSAEATDLVKTSGGQTTMVSSTVTTTTQKRRPSATASAGGEAKLTYTYSAATAGESGDAAFRREAGTERREAHTDRREAYTERREGHAERREAYAERREMYAERREGVAEGTTAYQMSSSQQPSTMQQGYTSSVASATGVVSSAYASGSSPVVKREYGEKRLVSVTERTDETRSQIISESITEHEVRIPKKIIREEVFERIVVVPERRMVEEIVEAPHYYKEKVIRRTKPVIQEKVIEVPEIEYVENIVEREEVVVVEEVVERVVGEPEVIYEKEYRNAPAKRVDPSAPRKTVTVYKDVPTPREVVVNVPRQKVVRRKVPVTVPRQVRVPKHVARKLPIPVALEARYEYNLPQLRPVYTKQSFPIYIPRFIEVPVAQEILTPAMTAATQAHLERIKQFPHAHETLCEIEGVAADIMKHNVQNSIGAGNAQEAVRIAWESGTLRLDPPKVAA